MPVPYKKIEFEYKRNSTRTENWISYRSLNKALKTFATADKLKALCGEQHLLEIITSKHPIFGKNIILSDTAVAYMFAFFYCYYQNGIEHFNEVMVSINKIKGIDSCNFILDKTQEIISTSETRNTNQLSLKFEEHINSLSVK
jgi:hypothetical protein